MRSGRSTVKMGFTGDNSVHIRKNTIGRGARKGISPFLRYPFWEKRIEDSRKRRVLFYIKKFETIRWFLAFSLRIWYSFCQIMFIGGGIGRMKPVLCLCVLLFLLMGLTGCSELFPKSGQNVNMPPVTVETEPGGETTSVLPEEWDVTVTEPTDKLTVESLSMVVTEKTIRELEEYPNLKQLDLSGSTCYTAIMVYIQNHPQVDVTYYVDFGGTSAINWAEHITLPDAGMTFQILRDNLVYLPRLQTLHLPMTSLSYSQIQALRSTYPDVEITYTVGFRGMEFTEDTESVNLAGMTVDEITSVISMLECLPNLSYAELMSDAGTCALSRQDVKLLVQAAPTVRFHYVFDLFGRTVSTTDQEIRFTQLSLTPAAEPEIREALSIMAPGSSLILDRCGLSSELLDSIRADYTNVDLVWRVYFGKNGQYTTLTNDDTIRAVYNVTDDTCYEMRYLRSAKYIDMGHNDYLTDVSFLAFMPDLEILILSGSAVSDLSGIENCKKLEFLELANCLKLADISPLSGCASLKYLNICYTKVSSLMPLDGLDIQNLFCKQTRVNAEEQKQYKEIHEGTVAVFSGKDPYAGAGWRYVDNGYTYTEFYKKVRQVFDLDAVDARLKAQEAANKK